MANAAADPKAPTNIRPATVLIDPTYNSKRENTARVAAINAKFTQNQHFTKLLLATKNAMLYHYTPGKKPEVATNLILIRKNLV